jgi:hypothetical protein
MIVVPSWHASIHVPSSVGDDVTIGSLVTVDANTVFPQTFQVSVQPRAATGALSQRARAIAALLQSSHTQTAAFLDKYLAPHMTPAEIDQLRIPLKDLLENHRSALDYTAHHIADYCNPKPPQSQVQFPVAKSHELRATFEPKLDRWFPGLASSKPKVRDYLLSIQEFSNELWLRELADLTNFNKHHSLSDQELADFHSVLVRFRDAGLRLGALGLRSLTLTPAGVLRFVDSSGEHADLEGPRVLDASTSSLPSADPRIEVVPETRKLYRIHGCKESIAGTLWSIDKNVFRAIDDIHRLLS